MEFLHRGDICSIPVFEVKKIDAHTEGCEHSTWYVTPVSTPSPPPPPPPKHFEALQIKAMDISQGKYLLTVYRDNCPPQPNKQPTSVLGRTTTPPITQSKSPKSDKVAALASKEGESALEPIPRHEAVTLPPNLQVAPPRNKFEIKREARVKTEDVFGRLDGPEDVGREANLLVVKVDPSVNLVEYVSVEASEGTV